MSAIARIVDRVLAASPRASTFLPAEVSTGVNEDKVIEYWESQPRRGVSDPISGYVCGEITTPGCNDTIRLDLRIENRIIKDVLHSGKGCVLSQAGASMLTELLIGKTVEEAAALTYDSMFDLFGGRPVPNRLGCCILPLRVLHSVI